MEKQASTAKSTNQVKEEIKPTTASRQIERQKQSEWRYVETAHSAVVVAGGIQLHPRWSGLANTNDVRAVVRKAAAAFALYEALQALLPYLTDRAQMLDYASLNEGRASGFDVASVKAREAIALVDTSTTDEAQL